MSNNYKRKLQADLLRLEIKKAKYIRQILELEEKDLKEFSYLSLSMIVKAIDGANKRQHNKIFK